MWNFQVVSMFLKNLFKICKVLKINKKIIKKIVSWDEYQPTPYQIGLIIISASNWIIISASNWHLMIIKYNKGERQGSFIKY